MFFQYTVSFHIKMFERDNHSANYTETNHVSLHRQRHLTWKVLVVVWVTLSPRHPGLGVITVHESQNKQEQTLSISG